MSTPRNYDLPRDGARTIGTTADHDLAEARALYGPDARVIEFSNGPNVYVPSGETEAELRELIANNGRIRRAAQATWDGGDAA